MAVKRHRKGLEMRRLSWNELNPMVTHANFIKCPPGFQWGPRTVYEHQFIYIVKGKGHGQIQDRSYQAASGDLFYYGPGVGHCFRADSELPFEIITMHFEFIGRLEDSGKPPMQAELGSTIHDAGLSNLAFIEERGSEELQLADYLEVSGKGIEE